MSRSHKKYKVRRFGQIYSPRRSTPSIVLRTVLTLVLVFVLAFVGWNAYGPIRDYFSGALAAASHRQEAPAPSSTPEPEEPPPEEAKTPEELRAAYIPSAMLTDEIILDTVFDRLEGTEINAILFDLKDAAGTVLYQSDLDAVATADVQADAAFDLEALCARLKDRGLVPMGRLSAFADPQAASRLPGAGVKYMNTETLWLDNSQENGGKGWLNPYAQPARDYLASLVSEAASKGVERIVLEQFSFPTGVGLEFANFGTNAASISQSTILASAFGSLEKAAGDRCAVSLYVPGLAALGEQNQYYGDQNPLTLADNVTLGLMPAQFGDGYATEGFSLDTPVLLPYDTMKKILDRLSSALSGKETTVMVQGFTTTGTSENNKVYTIQDIESQIRAVTESGVKNYIVYSPGGNYPGE